MLVEIDHARGDVEFVQIKFDGRRQFYVEEDKVNWQNNTLSKNFAYCYLIRDMLEKVYIAGQKGEPVEFQVNVIE